MKRQTSVKAFLSHLGFGFIEDLSAAPPQF